MVLFLIELRTRKVEIAGIAPMANGLWMEQIGRNLTDAVDGILKGKRYLIHDGDPLFTSAFLKVLGESGVASVKLPARSPNLNTYAERFVRTIKESCLKRLILFGEGSVRRAAAEFTIHYHCERNHQGPRQQADLPRFGSCPGRRRSETAGTSWRIAELLLQSRCLNRRRMQPQLRDAGTSASACGVQLRHSAVAARGSEYRRSDCADVV